MQYLQNDDYVIVLDEKGREYSTVEFAAILERMLMLQKKRIIFIIGGA
jgi:23S rRNA (pseudouridine1915-N3)-methyltransferase